LTIDSRSKSDKITIVKENFTVSGGLNVIETKFFGFREYVRLVDNDKKINWG